MDGWMDGWMDGDMDGWMRVDGWMDGWMDGWTYKVILCWQGQRQIVSLQSPLYKLISN